MLQFVKQLTIYKYTFANKINIPVFNIFQPNIEKYKDTIVCANKPKKLGLLQNNILISL